MNTDTVLQARALVGGLTPLKSDCGALCGAACCQADEDGQGGMYLFPGEEARALCRRKIHIPQIGDIPRTHDNPPRIGIVFYRLYHFRNLVDIPAIIIGPRTPLIAVNMP